MNSKTSLPENLKIKDCERFDPTKVGGAPPIRFVPETETTKESSEKDSKKQRYVKITAVEGITKTYDIFHEGNAEAICRLIRDHEQIVEDKKLQERLESTNALIRAKRAERDEVDKLEDPEKFLEMTEAIKELKATKVSFQAEAYDLFEKLLARTLVSKWREIVKEQCDTVPYIDLNGKKVTSGPRGRTLAALKPCMFQVMLWNTDEDAAEAQRKYWQNCVRKAKNVNCSQFIERLRWANILIEYLPCLKHRAGSPKELPRSNEPFTDIDLCSIVLNALPKSLAGSYWAHKGKHIPVDLKKLEDDLEVIERQEAIQYNKLEDIRAKVGLSTPGSKTGISESSPKGLDGLIPRKKKKAKGADGNALTPSNKKQCNFCMQWSPQIAHTHNTAQCRKWNKDGTPKKASSSFTPAQKKAYQIAKSNEETKKVFMAMKKQQKALAKLLKKSQKKGKRKMKHYDSSSDDSSSGSESE